MRILFAALHHGYYRNLEPVVEELARRGHDVHLIPVYTPTRTDEPNVSTRRVLFGGISVYLQQHVGFFRRLPRAFDRVWDSPAVISAFANRSGTTDPGLLGELTISMLQGTRGVLRREFDKLIEWTRDEPAPDVINLSNSLLIAMAAPLRVSDRFPVPVPWRPTALLPLGALAVVLLALLWGPRPGPPRCRKSRSRTCACR